MRNSIYKVIIIWIILLAPFSWMEAQVSDDAFSRECENALRLSLAQRYDEAIPVYSLHVPKPLSHTAIKSGASF